MSRLSRHTLTAAVLAIPLVLASLALGGASRAGLPAASAAAPMGAVVKPTYDAERQLLLPEDWRRWVFVGSSLGLSYSEGEPGMEMFHETLMEPSAYDHFARTGEFVDGTMLALLLHPAGASELPQRRGRFAGDLGALELAVKDSRAPELWSYYGFGTPGGLRDRAAAVESSSCRDCHRQHAAHDNVFLQFYPLLADVAPSGTVFRNGDGVEFVSSHAAAAVSSSTVPALEGLDVVLLAEGVSELGKPEIVVTYQGSAYHFVSEPTRRRFAEDPGRYVRASLP